MERKRQAERAQTTKGKFLPLEKIVLQNKSSLIKLFSLEHQNKGFQCDIWRHKHLWTTNKESVKMNKINVTACEEI